MVVRALAAVEAASQPFSFFKFTGGTVHPTLP